MKKFLIPLSGLIVAYLLSVGVFNAWNFLAGLEPTEVIKRLLFFAWSFAVSSYITWVILIGLFDID